VKQIIEKNMKVDARVTVLGHVQRGGSACAFDRYMATILGADAVDCLLNTTPETSAKVIGMSENHIVRFDLKEATEKTQNISEAIKQKQFQKVAEARGRDFLEAYKTFTATALAAPLSEPSEVATRVPFRLGIVHTGAPCCGMNMATRIATRVAIDRGHQVYGICNGFSGLIAGEVKTLERITVDNWANLGGSELGTNRSLPNDDLGLVAFRLQQYKINALLIIGGYEAFHSVLQLFEARSKYPIFCIPIVCLPATISNNVPGTEYSIGSDTALNVIIESCDRVKQSATSSRKRSFVVEVQGGMSGYLATIGGIACGCTRSYIPEEGITIRDLCNDIGYLIRTSKDKVEGRIVLRNEHVNDLYTTEFITALFNKEGEGYFDCRHVILGHLQQGGAPSPLDRVRAARLATLCIDFLQEQVLKMDTKKALNKTGSQEGIYTDSEESASIIGLKGTSIVFTPVVHLLSETNTELRRPKKQWWIKLRSLLKILANYEGIKHVDGISSLTYDIL
jgi:6-phosphofructokinase 1